LTWTWHLLGQHPAAYDRLQEEVSGVLNADTESGRSVRRRSGRLPTFDDLPHLPYTQMVVQESLRLMAPIWAIGRRAVNDDVIDGYHIPAGAYITMSPYLTHRHPDFWENPEQFDPERFTPERSAQRDRLAYVPFGMGQRLCIGKDLAELEIPLIVATLAQEFRLHPYPDPPVIIDSRLTLQPKHGLPMQIKMVNG
jgi:cytochrome P450